MPAQKRLWSNDHDGVQDRRTLAIQLNEEPPITVGERDAADLMVR